MIQLYAVQNRSDRIVPRLQQQIERAPKQPDFHELIGNAYFAKADLKNAEQEFDAALKLNPDSTVSRLQLSRVYAASNRLPEAIQMTQDLIQKNPDYLAARLLLGALYEQTGNIPQAEQTYQKALERDADFVPALNNLAWLLCENGGNLDMALSFAERAKAKLPSDPTISDTLAWIQYRKGLYSLALDEFRDLTHSRPENAVYKYHLGMTLFKVGKDDEARQCLKQALASQLAPSYASQAKVVLSQIN